MDSTTPTTTNLVMPAGLKFPLFRPDVYPYFHLQDVSEDLAAEIGGKFRRLAIETVRAGGSTKSLTGILGMASLSTDPAVWIITTWQIVDQISGGSDIRFEATGRAFAAWHYEPATRELSPADMPTGWSAILTA